MYIIKNLNIYLCDIEIKDEKIISINFTNDKEEAKEFTYLESAEYIVKLLYIWLGAKMYVYKKEEL